MGRLWCLLLVTACTEHGESLANQVTLSISGNLSQVADTGNPIIARIGDPFTGTIVYRADAVDTGEVDSAIYRFGSPPSGIEIKINGVVFESEPTALDMLINVVNGPGSDTLVFQSMTNRCIGCLGVELLSWQLDDSTGTALTGTDLPTDPPDLTRFTQQAGLSINGGGLGGFFLKGEVAVVVEL